MSLNVTKQLQMENEILYTMIDAISSNLERSLDVIKVYEKENETLKLELKQLKENKSADKTLNSYGHYSCSICKTRAYLLDKFCVECGAVFK